MNRQNKNTPKTSKPRDNKDIKATVDRFVHTLAQMQSILEEETDYLKKADSDSFFRMQDRKIAAAHAYSDQVQAMMDMGTLLKEKYPSLVPYLQNKRDELHRHIQDNERELSRMQRSTQRLSDRIMEIARKAAVEQNSVSYSAGGRLGDMKKASIGISESA